MSLGMKQCKPVFNSRQRSSALAKRGQVAGRCDRIPQTRLPCVTAGERQKGGGGNKLAPCRSSVLAAVATGASKRGSGAHGPHSTPRALFGDLVC